MGRRVLIVDDEKNFALLLAAELGRLGFETSCAHDADGALAKIEHDEFDALLLDIRMPGRDGIAALRDVKRIRPQLEVIMLTGHATIETALEAMRAGAYDYLTKPCKIEELQLLLEKAIERSDALADRRALRSYLGAGAPEMRMVGDSPEMTELQARIEKIALAIDVPVLISGESGTGKELIAREIHRRSPVGDEAFVAINCAALQTPVLESELFGHEKGAFTGALKRKVGLLELARGGTLFLDEVGEVEEQIQAKLLRFVQFGEYRRVGGTENLHVALRIIAASNRDLKKALAAGRFREDLYYRLNVVELRAPSLRERPVDILPLTRHFIRKYGGARRETIRLTAEAEAVLLSCPWHGNVRELENCVRRVLIFLEGAEITAQSLEQCLGAETPRETGSRSLRLEDVERDHILRVLKLSGDNKTDAAEKLGIALKTLYNKLNSYKEPPVDESRRPG
ncbi:MAG: sigma-54-dependent transcriptional regulator [Planctomycetota bacterium]